MNLAVIGTGYVGLVSGACLADFGHSVTCVDSDASRVDRLGRGEVPFYEPGLAEIVQRNAAAGRLRFTTSVTEAVDSALVIFLAVGTPQGPAGEADLSQIDAAAYEIAARLDTYRVIVTKSTVPVGTGGRLQELISAHRATHVAFDVVSNPEFLREGSAVNDFMRPDRVVIGTNSDQAAAIMREIYRPLYLIETPVVMTDVETSETIKYASNAFLAVKISFINEIANLCDRTGADVHVVAKGMGLDRRIGSKFLHPGPGYGGSCFPKDTQALAAIGRRHGVTQEIVEAAIKVNRCQRDVVLQKIRQASGGLSAKVFAVLGLAFKPNTSDVRESPALDVCRRIVADGGRVRAFDPVASQEAACALAALSPSIVYSTDAYEAATGADAVVVMTEWNEFRSLDIDRLKSVMAGSTLVDTRNVFEPDVARRAGFTYVGMGRGKKRESVNSASRGGPAGPTS
jgi:UDPglucose 6-dehydrogenase